MRGILAKVGVFCASNKAVVIPIASVLGAGVIAAGGYAGYKALNKAPVKEPEEVVVEITDSDEEPKIDVPEFMSCFISSESIEKDLTIYIADSNDECITGTEFQVKLVDPKEAETLSDYVVAIQDINKQIAELTGDVNLDTGEKKEDKKDEESKDAEVKKAASTYQDVEVTITNEDGEVVEVVEPNQMDNPLTQLYLDKAVALQAYTIALQEIEGKVYVDEDKDGVIAQEEMEPGDYAAMLLYDESWEVGYDPTSYVLDVNVKDKIEYKVVDVSKKVEKYDKKEDGGEKKAVTEVEATLTDTVEYVESSQSGEASPKPAKAVAPTLSDSTVGNVKDGAPTKTTVSKTVTSDGGVTNPDPTPPVSDKKYKLTVIHELYSSDGATLISSDTASKEYNDGEVFTVDIPSIDGYDYWETDGDINGVITSDLTVKIKYKKIPDQSASVGKHRVSVTAAGTTKVTETVGLSMSYDAASGKFNIAADMSKANGATLVYSVNGTTVTGKTYSPNGDGDYVLDGTVTFTDGSTETLTQTWTLSTKKSAGNLTDQLKDAAGNLLFKDKELKTKATVADYKEDATYYFAEKNFTYYGWQTLNGIRYYFDKNGVKVTGTQVILGVKYSFGTDGALLTNGTGIDVSYHQGNIDWKSASSAISFAIIRCGYRGMYDGLLHEDPKFYTNMKSAKANGVKTGIYIYSTALTEAEAVEEASMAVRMAQAAGGVSYPIYYDMEDTYRGQHKLSNEQRTALINAFCGTVQSSGYRAGVYASKNWLETRVNTGNISGSVSVWCAQYNTKCTYGKKFDMWQSTSKGSIPGIKGNVDIDTSYF